MIFDCRFNIVSKKKKKLGQVRNYVITKLLGAQILFDPIPYLINDPVFKNETYFIFLNRLGLAVCTAPPPLFLQAGHIHSGQKC